MLIFLSIFTELNRVQKRKEYLTFHHMGIFLLVNFEWFDLKSGG